VIAVERAGYPDCDFTPLDQLKNGMGVETAEYGVTRSPRGATVSLRKPRAEVCVAFEVPVGVESPFVLQWGTLKQPVEMEGDEDKRILLAGAAPAERTKIFQERASEAQRDWTCPAMKRFFDSHLNSK
jgi:hypothetical protein